MFTLPYKATVGLLTLMYNVIYVTSSYILNYIRKHILSCYLLYTASLTVLSVFRFWNNRFGLNMERKMTYFMQGFHAAVKKH